MSNTQQIKVTCSSMPSFDEYVAEITPLWESRRLTNMGEKHRQFQAALEARLGVKVSLYVNGHNALEGAIEAFHLGEDGRRKVITTPFTFASTTHAIVRKGLTPVFADVRDDNYTLDPAHIETLIDDETCAIVPVHVYGNLCDVDTLEAIARKHGIKLIYDAAHAFGVERRVSSGVAGFDDADRWESTASFGDASVFSFHATKVFNTVEGGAVCFKNPALASILNQRKNFGLRKDDDCDYIGGNAKMNEFCAAMGLCNLRHLDGEIAKRRAATERYWDILDGLSGIKLCKPPEGVRHNYAYLPVLFDTEKFGASRDAVFDALAAEDIGARKYFYPLTSDFFCYKGRFAPSEVATPVAHRVASQVLSLPLYADLSLKDVEHICTIVKTCAR